MFKLLALFALTATAVCAKSTGSGVTFQNVTIRGYSIYTFKFNVTIQNANSLKDHLPKMAFDHIEILDSKIPVLYENSIDDIDNLDELTLENNDLEEIRPGAFKNVPQFRKLTIRHNDLTEIREGVFNNLPIATLDLSKNKIKDIAPGAFNDMVDLLNINLADNQLSAWDKNWFENTPLLTRVSMQNNLIGKIPAGAFRNLAGIKKFGRVDLTVNIVLSHNKINRIENGAFDDLVKMAHLWLDNNAINEWNEDLLSGKVVADLRLNSNSLSCLEGDLSKILVADTTHLDGNPWDCKCLANIKSWAEEHKKDVQMSYASMTCDAERIDRKLKDLKNLLIEIRKNNVENDKPDDQIETLD